MEEYLHAEDELDTAGNLRSADLPSARRRADFAVTFFSARRRPNFEAEAALAGVLEM